MSTAYPQPEDHGKFNPPRGGSEKERIEYLERYIGRLENNLARINKTTKAVIKVVLDNRQEVTDDELDKALEKLDRVLCDPEPPGCVPVGT